MKQKSDFFLIGLSRPKSMTCVVGQDGEIFHPKNNLPQDRFNALWDYFSTNKPMKMIAEIEHYGLSNDGTPINGTVLSVRDI